MAKEFSVLGINHIGMVAKDPVKARNFFEKILGLSHLGDEFVKAQHTHTSMLTSHSSVTESSVSSPRLELLVPDEDPEGPIAKFLVKKGSGIHHIALQVDSIEGAIRYLKTQGVRLIDESPRVGAHATSIAFVHPESTGGLLVELVQENREDSL